MPSARRSRRSGRSMISIAASTARRCATICVSALRARFHPCLSVRHIRIFRIWSRRTACCASGPSGCASSGEPPASAAERHRTAACGHLEIRADCGEMDLAVHRVDRIAAEHDSAVRRRADPVDARTQQHRTMLTVGKHQFHLRPLRNGAGWKADNRSYSSHADGAPVSTRASRMRWPATPRRTVHDLA